MRVTKMQKEVIIGEVFNLLNTHTDQKEIYDLISHKYKIQERQFMRYWKLASEKHLEQQRAINMAVIGEHTSILKERLKTALWTQEEILFKLQDRAAREKNSMAFTGMLKLICDIQGFKAPEKKDININNIKPIFSTNPLLNGIKEGNNLNT